MYAEILFSQKVGTSKDTLIYKVPESLEKAVQKGKIVEIPLRNKRLRGVVAKIHHNQPDYPTKEILELAKEAAHLQEWQLELISWISDYYFCPAHRVLKQFFPMTISQKKHLPAYQSNSLHTDWNAKKLTLTVDQKRAFETIMETDKQIALLHGITSSGKTEIYRRLAEKQLEQDKQVLILIPEISLTPQTFEAFEAEFGSSVAVLHSQLTTKTKERFWYKIYHGEAKIIIGSRSALFAPFANLGLIVMDEEHEFSYKQDQAPRYHARDVALKIAELLKIKVVLGSATPSLESYHQATQNNYKLVELKQRIHHKNSVQLPAVTIVDLREEIRKKNFSIFSEVLREGIAEKLSNERQIILFLNRRGAACAVLCRECGHIEKCDNCDVAMTYHRQISAEQLILPAERLICHHCNKIKKIPVLCPKCGSTFIRYLGLGTQRVEEETRKLFPKARILRADRDTVKQRNSFEKLYKAFKNHEADILIGTQMIGKGLHLPHVSLVGVILADLSLTIPDFRSSERTFQILTQVAGRAGREAQTGEVIIQTYIPESYVIQKSIKHDYQGFFEEEIKIRKSFAYPPFNKLIKLTISSKDAEKCLQKAANILGVLENTNKTIKNAAASIASYPALISKIQNMYRWHILITGQNPEMLLKNLPENAKKLLYDKSIKIDVDPMSSM